MKVKFVTCIYNDLYGTEYGGRPSRNYHYKYSLLSLLKMTDANFVLYTSRREHQTLQEFYYSKHSIPETQLEIKEFELHSFKYFNEIRKIKDLEKTTKSDRCYEIQYSKFYWLEKELEGNFTHVYWVDAGLSHTGLFPPEFKLSHKEQHREYYDFSLFNNTFLKNLINITENKVFVIGKDNTKGNYWSPSLPSTYYKKYDRSIHIIGGLFGGKVDKVRQYIRLFDDLLKSNINNQEIFYEELLMSTLYFNFKERFKLGYFEIWWYPTNGPYPPDNPIYTDNKSFFEIFKELQ